MGQHRQEGACAGTGDSRLERGEGPSFPRVAADPASLAWPLSALGLDPQLKCSRHSFLAAPNRFTVEGSVSKMRAGVQRGAPAASQGSVWQEGAAEDQRGSDAWWVKIQGARTKCMRLKGTG